MTSFIRTTAAAILVMQAMALSAHSAETDAPPPIPSFELPVAERIGRDMFRIDQAAARATDILRASGVDLARELRGWITEDTEDGILVRYVRLNDGNFVGAYDILMDKEGRNGKVTALANAPLSPAQSSQLSARALAMAQIAAPCTQDYNSVTLKHPDKDAWLVYALAATNQPGVIVAGGHYRFVISQDGKETLEATRLSAGCLNLPPPPPNVAAAFLTHVVSATPIETHVFLNLLHQKALVVRTSDGVWIIDKGKILRAK